MNWFVVLIALAGVVLNVRKQWQGFLLWLVSNAYWCIHNTTIGEYPQAVLYAAFWLLAVYGIYCWRLKKTKAKDRSKTLITITQTYDSPPYHIKIKKQTKQ